MIEVLSDKISKENLKNIDVKVMDGQALELPNDSFDYLFCIFGVMFFPNPEKGFKVREITKMTPELILLLLAFFFVNRNFTAY